MSYFSRIQLDRQHPLATEALLDSNCSNAYQEHQWLWRFFPAEKGSPRGFLFRRMDVGGEQLVTIYTVSETPPLPTHPAWRVDTREFNPSVQNGDRLSFELRANPVVSIREDGKRSRRHDVVMHAKKTMLKEQGVKQWAHLDSEQRPDLYSLVHSSVADWLLGKEGKPGLAERHGFSVDRETLRVDAYRQHKLPRKDKSPILLSTVDIAGTLQVADPKVAVRAMMNGVGHAKAFGCGLLLVRRG